MEPGTSATPSAVDFLAAAVDSYTPFLQSSGELFDPVFGEPTQYGTAYHAFCNAVLSVIGEPSQRGIFGERAARGLDIALAHTADPSLPATASHFDPATGTIGRMNHRDFTWPPIVKSYRLLRNAGSDRAEEFAERIAAVDVECSFLRRPPSNWSSVWLSGEWIRYREGLSPYPAQRIDEWLGTFFDELLLLEEGFYAEPGLPNSYDLYTRYHLADMLAEGYDGRWREPMERLLVTGLERSLAVQLSDGSLASAHRSTGQTWTVGAQIAYFSHAARLLAATDMDRAARAQLAAVRAFASFTRWQRAHGPYSPVENCLPPAYRVGYEEYTADANYANLALAFLGTALLAGFDEQPDAQDQLGARSAVARVEHEPTRRAIAHHGEISVHVNANPAPDYDGFGITDLTLGPGRFLHFASAVHHVATGALFNLGMAHRHGPGRQALAVVAQEPLELSAPIQTTTCPEGVGLRLDARATNGSADESRTPPSTPAYQLSVDVQTDRAVVTESTPGLATYKTLLVPYLRDPGTGTQTEISISGNEIRLAHGAEHVEINLDADIEHVVHLPYGYQNRRGLCGLVRIDLRDASEGVTYQVRVVS